MSLQLKWLYWFLADAHVSHGWVHATSNRRHSSLSRHSYFLLYVLLISIDLRWPFLVLSRMQTSGLGIGPGRDSSASMTRPSSSRAMLVASLSAGLALFLSAGRFDWLLLASQWVVNMVSLSMSVAGGRALGRYTAPRRLPVAARCGPALFTVRLSQTVVLQWT